MRVRFSPEAFYLLLIVLFLHLSAFSLTHPILDSDFQKTINQSTKSEMISGNELKLLIDSKDSIPQKMEMVRSAKKSIFLSAMIFVTYFDTFAENFSNLLLQKVKEGIPVYLIIDDLSSYFDVRLFRKLEQGGVEIAYFNPTFGNDSTPFDIRMHEKMIIVDEIKATIGGQNLYDERYPLFQKFWDIQSLNWRDTDLYVEGPLVKSIVQHFHDMWNQISKKKMMDPPVKPEDDKFFAGDNNARDDQQGQARFLYNEPHHGQKFINKYYLRLIQLAQHEIIWQANQVVLSKEFEMALKEAAERGVKVILMSNSFSTSWWQPGWYQYFFVKGYLPFKDSKVKLHLYKTRYNHSKILYVDGVVASVGSFNHDLFSLNTDAESTVAIYDPKIISIVHKQILEDLKDTEEFVFPF